MNNAVINDQSSLKNISDTINGMVNREGESGDSNTETPDPEPEVPEWEGPTGIQDETVETEDGYGNKVTIPKGFEVVEEEGTTVPEGIVIQDKDGNQFVWIPVGRVYKDSTGTNYSDIQLGRYYFSEWDGTARTAQLAYTEENPKNYEELIATRNYFDDSYFEYATRENPQGLVDETDRRNDLNAIAWNLEGFINSVKINGGYYLARYEASYGSGTSVADYKPLSKISTSTKFSTSKVGSLWNWVEQMEAAKISRNMYNGDISVGVESDLVNSYAWDTALVFIQEMGNDDYSNKPSVNRSLANTGTTGDEVCNIHDMASNCLEWTTEYCDMVEGDFAYPCVTRGGYIDSGSGAMWMMPWGANHGTGVFSFRPILYIKQELVNTSE